MLKLLVPALALFASPIYAQQCGFWTHPQAGAPLQATGACYVPNIFPNVVPMDPSTQSYVLNCDQGGSMIQTQYNLANCTGTVLSTVNATSQVSPYRCGAQCSRTQTQSAQTPCSGNTVVWTASLGAPDVCLSGEAIYCDATDLVTVRYGTNDPNCQNLANTAASVTREPLTKCFVRNRFSNCFLAPGVTQLPIVIGVNSLTMTETSGQFCNGTVQQSVQARIGSNVCAEPKELGIRQFCGTSGGSVWQYYYQNDTLGDRLNCGSVLIGAMFINTGVCTANVNSRSLFNPIDSALSQTFSCTSGTAQGNPPPMDFGTNQYARVRVYRNTSGTCLTSEFLYEAYVLADGTCEGGSPFSYRRYCQADGSLVTSEFQGQVDSCTGGSSFVRNYTWNNNSCNAYTSNRVTQGTTEEDVSVVVLECGTGVNPLDPNTVPNLQRFNTSAPSQGPSTTPSRSPSMTPSKMPTNGPSTTPSRGPSNAPSKHPSRAPSLTPSKAPSQMPSKSPSNHPSLTPTRMPSQNPTTTAPSKMPTRNPSSNPSKAPSKGPSMTPSKNPSTTPSTSSPSKMPSTTPTKMPSLSPTKKPSGAPSMMPTTVSGASGIFGPGGRSVAVAVAMVVVWVLVG